MGTVVLVPLADCARTPGVGAKAANLALLAQRGYRVAPGVVVPAAAYRRHLAESGALPAAQAFVDAADAKAIRAALSRMPVDPGLLDAIERHFAGTAGPFAVRSSAAAEDSGAASFAGQLDSVLHVTGRAALEQAIRTVWASAWSERCVAYAQRLGAAPGHVAVIVQAQVDARWSGVLFSRDPVAGEGEPCAVVESVRGLGDRLVAGAVDPCRLRVAHANLVPEILAGAPDDALPVPLAVELARAGLALERDFGSAVDVEWSVDPGGRLVLHQCRPVTAALPDHWTNANIGENFPGPVTPFLFSIVRAGYTAYFRNLGRSFGLSASRIRAMGPRLEHLVGLHGARLFYNLTNIHGALRLAPGGTHLAGWFNQFTGARGSADPGWREPPALAHAAEVVRVALSVAWRALGIRRGVARFERRIDAFAARTRPEALAQRDEYALAQDLEGFLDIRLHRWNDAALADAAAMVSYGLLQRVLPQGAQGTTLQNELLKGLPGLASARPVAELWKLSQAIRAEAPYRELFAGSPPEVVALRLAEPRFAPLQARFRTYVEQWGFRYSGELMLTSATPREDPVPMIRLLQAYLRSDGEGPESIGARQGRDRIAATRRVRASLGTLDALRLSLVLRATQGAIGLRERARMKQALLYTRLRHVALRLGECFVARGVIDCRDDVFFLEVDEALALARGGDDGRTVRDRVAGRRAHLEAQSRCTPPDAFSLARGARWQGTSAPAAALAIPSAWRGTGASAGDAVGPARIVLDVADAGVLRSGDILVTPQTDPGWAAVFFLVHGLVVERGGMLSHGAIIAREYGIPAVVGVADATRRIPAGAHIHVDGGQGVVEPAAA